MPTPRQVRRRRLVLVVAVLGIAAGAAAATAALGAGGDAAGEPAASSMPGMDMGTPVATATPPPSSMPGTTAVAGLPSIYAGIGPGAFAPGVADDLRRVYVPNGGSNTVSVIDPDSRTVVATIPTGRQPQHVVPSYDLQTLWVLLNQGNAVIPIDAATGTPGAAIPVVDPYNLYFTFDGSAAVVVAEALQRLDLRDPRTMAPVGSLPVPGCAGINHVDYDRDGTYVIASCEFAGKLVKIDLAHGQVLGFLDLAALDLPGQPHPATMAMPGGHRAASMPQDVRAAPDGEHFYVADMMSGGVFVIDGDTFQATAFIPTGTGAHGLTPSRDGTRVFVANRGSATLSGARRGPGSVSTIDVATGQVVATWPVPGGGSPDMGNLDDTGQQLWLSGRYDDEVYAFDTTSGALLARIPVGRGPHGLTFWPQPGTRSLGHTGNMR